MLLVAVLAVYAVGWLVAGAVIAVLMAKEVRDKVRWETAFLGAFFGLVWPVLLPIGLASLLVFIIARRIQCAD